MKLNNTLIDSVSVCGKTCLPVKILQQQKSSLGSQFLEFFSKLFNTNDWPPRWHCGNWTPFHGWLYIMSDLAIWAAYFAIPILLFALIRKRKDIPFNKIFVLFIAFILLCGLTHLIDAGIFWWPAYRLSALLRFITAVVSVFTVYALYRIFPLILTLRTVKDLEDEIEKRHVVEVALNRSLELATKNNQQLHIFTHILSHNIRNHASNISMLSSMVDMDVLDTEHTEIFDRLKTVSNGLNSTLSDLSEVIKIKETLIEANVVNISEITNHVLKIFELSLEHKQAQVNLKFDVAQVNFPRIYLESILTNLISNAVKYRSTDKHLKIDLKTYYDENNHAVLTCTDNGLGIDMKAHGEKLFGLYNTFHNHKEAHGVGLFLIKTQVESQGGHIFVESAPGFGTTFKIVFNDTNKTEHQSEPVKEV